MQVEKNVDVLVISMNDTTVDNKKGLMSTDPGWPAQPRSQTVQSGW